MIRWILSVQVIIFVFFMLGHFKNVCLCPCSLSLYSFNELDGLVFVWQIAVWFNWFLNTFLAKRHHGISFPLLSYISNKLGSLPMFYRSTTEHRQGSTISDPYESCHETCLASQPTMVRFNDKLKKQKVKTFRLYRRPRQWQKAKTQKLFFTLI